MEPIKVEAAGNIARIIAKPSKITSGTVGLPVEFTFDSQWDGLRKIVVFRAGNVIKSVENPTVVPWEVLEKPGVWLSVGVYGTNADGTEVIPTTWANVCPIQIGVNPDGDPSTDPTLPIWQTMMNYFASLATKPASKVTYVTLLASAWAGADGLYSQVVAIDGITEYSQVDLKPNAEQLALFHEKDLALATENEDGVVTVYAIGDKPTSDYTIQVSITEVVA
jgi:hypothetical protein